MQNIKLGPVTNGLYCREMDLESIGRLLLGGMTITSGEYVINCIRSEVREDIQVFTESKHHKFCSYCRERETSFSWFSLGSHLPIWLSRGNIDFIAA